MNDIFFKFPKIVLKKSVLRNIQLEDVKDFYKYITNKNITKTKIGGAIFFISILVTFQKYHRQVYEI